VTTDTPTRPPKEQQDQISPPVRDWVVSYRIGIESTGRVLLMGFHIEARFTDKPHLSGSVAEFGDIELAVKVIRELHYATPLVVLIEDWEKATERDIQQLCRRIADTGASANMLFWNPGSRTARAHMGQKSAGGRL